MDSRVGSGGSVPNKPLASITPQNLGASQKGGFQKGWLWRMLPRDENRNEAVLDGSAFDALSKASGALGKSEVKLSPTRGRPLKNSMKIPGIKTGTRVRSHVPPERKTGTRAHPQSSYPAEVQGEIFLRFSLPKVGACAMTTKFLDNKIFTFKILLS